MRYGRGIAAMVVAVALLAPATAMGVGDGREPGGARVESAAVAGLDGDGFGVGWLLERFEQMLQAVWGATRGSIVPDGSGGGGG